MGLSISRRIIESHGGRLWTSANAGPPLTSEIRGSRLHPVAWPRRSQGD
jgi:signal transduction histidine kinase